VFNQGIGRLSPTMARPKAKRRVHKDQLALAVRKNFNALGVTESDVIVDWLYKAKNQGILHMMRSLSAILTVPTENEFRIRFAPQRK
jgi:histone deacetylase complex subunit SAP30